MTEWAPILQSVAYDPATRVSRDARHPAQPRARRARSHFAEPGNSLAGRHRGARRHLLRWRSLRASRTRAAVRFEEVLTAQESGPAVRCTSACRTAAVWHARFAESGSSRESAPPDADVYNAGARPPRRPATAPFRFTSRRRRPAEELSSSRETARRRRSRAAATCAASTFSRTRRRTRYTFHRAAGTSTRRGALLVDYKALDRGAARSGSSRPSVRPRNGSSCALVRPIAAISATASALQLRRRARRLRFLADSFVGGAVARRPAGRGISSCAVASTRHPRASRAAAAYPSRGRVRIAAVGFGAPPPRRHLAAGAPRPTAQRHRGHRVVRLVRLLGGTAVRADRRLEGLARLQRGRRRSSAQPRCTVLEPFDRRAAAAISHHHLRRRRRRPRLQDAATLSGGDASAACTGGSSLSVALRPPAAASDPTRSC